MILRSALSEVRTSLSALTTITWSPVSMCGANTGLCLPRSTRATSVASRPRTMPSASTTYQARWISEAFGVYVGTRATFIGFLRCGRRAIERAVSPERRTSLRADTAERQTRRVIGWRPQGHDDVATGMLDRVRTRLATVRPRRVLPPPRSERDVTIDHERARPHRSPGRHAPVGTLGRHAPVGPPRHRGRRRHRPAGRELAAPGRPQRHRPGVGDPRLRRRERAARRPALAAVADHAAGRLRDVRHRWCGDLRADPSGPPRPGRGARRAAGLGA